MNIMGLFNSGRYFCILFFIVLLGEILVLPKNASAVTFDQAVLRLDSTTPNTQTGGTVCTKTTTVGSESIVAVTFPQGFNLNGNASNWTVSNTNLPSGATAWPGIGTASLVSGQTVTFPSSDLAINTLYCFHFSGSSTLTTGNAGNDQNGQINTVINTSTFGLSINSSNEVNVTAGVDAGAGEYTVDLFGPTTNEAFSQGSEIDFRVDYETRATQVFPMTLEVGWTQGTIEADAVPSIEIAQYIGGSASNAYQSVVPIIDLTNRKISWSIPNLVASAGTQSVRFRLRTTDTYTPKNFVQFTVFARIRTVTNALTPDSISTIGYRYQSSLSPAEAPSSGSYIAPNTSPPNTPRTVVPLINDINFDRMTATNALLNITLNERSSLEIKYGTNSKKLDLKLAGIEKSISHLVSLDNLTPETAYYFIVSMLDEKGKTNKSDIYTFTTPKIAEIPRVNPQSVILSVGNLVLYNSALQKKDEVILPIDTPYGINFDLESMTNAVIKNVQIRVKKQQGLAEWTREELNGKKVLGVSTVFAQEELNTTETKLIPTSPNRYGGVLKTNLDPGDYEIETQVSDFLGNINNTKIASLRVITPFYILDKDTSKPVERASLTLSLYNPELKIFEPVTGKNLPFTNSVFSDLSGTIFMPLVRGRYKAEIQALGYQNQEKEFEINLDTTKNYPIFYLPKGSTNFIMMFGYYKTVLLDVLQTLFVTIRDLAASNWIFDLGAFLTLGLLTVLTYLAFFYKTHFRLSHLIIPFKDKIRKSPYKCETITGMVSDRGDHKSLANAEIILIDKESDQVIHKTATSKKGIFMMSGGLIKELHNYKIVILKDGFIPFETDLKINAGFNSCKIERYEPITEKVRTDFAQILEGVLNLAFDLLLIISLLIEILFISIFGYTKVLPFLAITILNIIIWAIYLHQSLFYAKKAV